MTIFYRRFGTDILSRNIWQGITTTCCVISQIKFFLYYVAKAWDHAYFLQFNERLLSCVDIYTSGMDLSLLLKWFWPCIAVNMWKLKCHLVATDGFFIADLIACSTYFGHHYAHHQELKSIIEWLLPVVFGAVVFKLSVWCRAVGCVFDLWDAAVACIILLSSWWWA